MADKLRIGIIGTGGIAHAHANAYRQMPDVEVVAGADIIPGKARRGLAGLGRAGGAAPPPAVSEKRPLEYCSVAEAR